MLSVLQSMNRSCTVGTCTPEASQLSCGMWLLFPGIVSCSPGWPVRREAAKGINWTFILLNDRWALLKLQRGVPMEGFSALTISVPPPEGPADLLL